MERRLVLFLILSSAIFLGWSYLYGRLNPAKPVQKPAVQAIQNEGASPALSSAPLAPSQTPAAVTPQAAALPQAPQSPTQAEVRDIRIVSDHWVAVLSSQGGVIKEWTMTSFLDGKPIDPPKGVNLLSSQLSQSIGGALRFHIPSDPGLEKQLNQAVYEVGNIPDQELYLQKAETKEVSFTYSGSGIEAVKTLIFTGAGVAKSTGFDFDIRATVKRNGAPVDAYLVIGPNFGDQAAKEVSAYKHAPQLTFAIGTSVSREAASNLNGAAVTPTSGPVDWAAVDDNYFAIALVPPRPAPAAQLLNDNYVSIAVQLAQGEINHVYAGPKDLNLLTQASQYFSISRNSSQLEDIVSYGWLNFLRVVIKPIAQFMLWGLREINKITHNFGWSIVLLTVFLNLFFFPLRWKSSVSMKRAAAMQPKMKDIQERMKKIDKNDPRMMDLQKEQIALMKEGNPLMGCLPLLLQMPFFMAVFAILTVSIEVRHAPFFGWLQDLSSPDPFWVLPIIMCLTMVLQQALTPTTADPIQKKMGYVMPIIFAWFLKAAPAGLVLYWMVSNIVGVVQQFIINRMNPTKPPATQDSSKTDDKKPAKGKKTKEALAN
ncbi:MAG: membrane protein insertase YidC [Acidobacteria bacterium]|nr:membrane protein insertase YidC [Acidobacteriota bacterium]